MITEEQVNQESFEAWLAEQPADREFKFTDQCGCLIATWLKHAVGHAAVRVSPVDMHIDGKQWLLPPWLRQVSDRANAATMVCQGEFILSVGKFRELWSPRAVTA